MKCIREFAYLGYYPNICSIQREMLLASKINVHYSFLNIRSVVNFVFLVLLSFCMPNKTDDSELVLVGHKRITIFLGRGAFTGHMTGWLPYCLVLMRHHRSISWSDNHAYYGDRIIYSSFIYLFFVALYHWHFHVEKGLVSNFFLNFKFSLFKKYKKQRIPMERCPDWLRESQRWSIFNGWNMYIC